MLAKIGELFEITIVKVVSAASVSLMFLFGEVYTQAIVAVGMLVLIDTVLGVAATYFEGKPITSRRFGRILVKGTVYFSAISAAYFADLTIPFDFIQASMLGFVGITEFISILENVGRLGYQTPKKLLNQLNNQVNKM